MNFCNLIQISVQVISVISLIRKQESKAKNNNIPQHNTTLIQKCFFSLLFFSELMFLETSAMSGENVEEAFLKCSRTILTKIDAGVSLISLSSHFLDEKKSYSAWGFRWF